QPDVAGIHRQKWKMPDLGTATIDEVDLHQVGAPPGNQLAVHPTPASEVDARAGDQKVLEEAHLVGVDVWRECGESAAVVDGHRTILSQIVLACGARTRSSMIRFGILGFGGAGQAHYF